MFDAKYVQKLLLWRQMLRKSLLWKCMSDAKYVQNHCYFEGKCLENCHFENAFDAPHMCKTITLKANAKEIITYKYIWHQICTKPLLWRQMLMELLLWKCIWHQTCRKTLLWRQMFRKLSLWKCVWHQICSKLSL